MLNEIIKNLRERRVDIKAEIQYLNDRMSMSGYNSRFIVKQDKLTDELVKCDERIAYLLKIKMTFDNE